jgi:hypothetical protein
MNRSEHAVHIADPLWQLLEQMSRQMDVDPDALVNQAIFTLARLNGFVTPKAMPIDDEDRASAPLGPNGSMPSPVGPVGTPSGARHEPSGAVGGSALAERVAPEVAPPLPSPPAPAPASPAAGDKPLPAAPAVAESGESSRAAMRAKAVERIRAIVQDVEAFVEPQPDPAPEQEAQDEAGDEEEDQPQQEAEQQEEQEESAAEEGEEQPEEEVPEEAAPEEGAPDGDTLEGLEPNTAEEGLPDEAEEPERVALQPVLQKPPASLQRADPFADRTIVQPARARLFLQLREHEPIEVVAERFLIGRGNHCNLIIDSVRVSREHAVLLSEGDGFVLEDQGSSNGTWLGTRRLQRHVISDGDVLMLGNEKVRFSVQPASAPASISSSAKASKI